MKYTYLIPLCLAFSSIVYAAEGPKLDNRDSLKFIFGNSSEEVDTALSERDFYLHIKGLEYALGTIGDQSEVEWSSSVNPDLTGKVVMLSTKQEKGTACKNFMETLNIKDKKYEGNAIVCFKDGHWVIDK